MRQWLNNCDECIVFPRGKYDNNIQNQMYRWNWKCQYMLSLIWLCVCCVFYFSVRMSWKRGGGAGALGMILHRSGEKKKSIRKKEKTKWGEGLFKKKIDWQILLVILRHRHTVVYRAYVCPMPNVLANLWRLCTFVYVIIRLWHVRRTLYLLAFHWGTQRNAGVSELFF